MYSGFSWFYGPPPPNGGGATLRGSLAFGPALASLRAGLRASARTAPHR
jgi:hypothetical protein